MKYSYSWLYFLICLFFVLSLQIVARHNVILVYTDDQGSVDAGCYGSDDLYTPTIDRLA